MRRVLLLLAIACSAVLLPAASAQASLLCDQMRGWLTRGGGQASGLLAVDSETGQVVCARAAGTQRPLASNMKLFTTSAALARLGPGFSYPDPGVQRRPARFRRGAARQPLPAGRRRPGARHPGLLRPIPQRAGNEPARPEAADPRRRHSRGHRQALRRRHDLRPRARRRRLRLRDQPLHRPPLRPRLRLRLRRVARRRLRLRPGQARRLEAGAGAARRGHPDRAAGGPRRDPGGQRTDRGRALADPDPDRRHNRRLLRQLLRRDADQAARRALRRPGLDRGGSRRGPALRAPARLRRARRRRLRPDPVGPRLAAAGGVPAAVDAEQPGRRRIHSGPRPRRRAKGPSPRACTARPRRGAAGPRPAP